MDVWRTAFREPRAAWTRLLTVELENRGRGRPRKLALKGTETDLYACGYVIGEWAVVHINTDNGRVNGVRYGVQFFCAAATRFYEGIGIHVPGARICVRGAGDALLEVHTVQSRSVLVARPGFATYSVPLPESASGWFLRHITDDVVVLTDRDGGAGRAVHYRPSTQLATSHAVGPRYHLPLSPRLAIPAAYDYETFFRSTDPERGLPLPARVVGLCRETKDGSAIQVQEDSGRARVRKNAHCTVVLLGHMHGDVSGNYIAGGDGQGKLALFWHVPLGTSLDILLGSASGARERDARASNSNLVKALRLGTVRVLLGQLLGA